MAPPSPVRCGHRPSHGPERLGSSGPSAMLRAGAARYFEKGCTLGSSGETTDQNSATSSERRRGDRMRRREFTSGLLVAAAIRTAQAREPAKQHRIAVIIPAGPVALISDSSSDSLSRRLYQAFFEELRRLGDVEGQNLIIERYSGEGRPEGYANLAREVVDRNPHVIVAITNPIAQAVRAASGTIPIVWIGVEGIRSGLAMSLARPGGNITGVDSYDYEIWGKRLQLLKGAVPSASKVAFLLMRGTWELNGQRLREMSRRLEISLIGMPLVESTPSEYQRVFAEIASERPDAIIVHDIGDLVPYRQLIIDLVEKSRLPAMYGHREWVEAGGLMAYEGDLGEAGRRMADDVYQILNGAKPGDIPIYQATKFALVINLRAAQALGLTIPPALLAQADEVIE
jgi:putative ABC transport system substrate-binding protein